ncbi:nucleoside triphosphate hydrolase [Thiohalorhabdus denitrificans]|uniref:ATP diphosphatase n=1 Tax=Thiohalorhabdus denitrificans TaxID=381306 RepID=A0A0P9CMT5_9GAMM|nr:nucleoside triphosphate pyrophosphohydrolase [Thiohalorhabdus denitrificans]KPV40399.1 nucleoside triphosphate hydrolase [Thiohalorhabdus denitrificans]SCY59688.1 ATP diphosphatase [Thiohalorhabdus denitrificans]
MAEMHRLLEIMARLRDPEGGCPWDRQQTFGSIVPHTLEEAYEVADAIERADWEHLPAELGDLLFQVVFYARLGEEAGRFDFRDVVEAVSAKLVRRHPHVFGAARVDSAEEQSRAWEAHKAEERAARRHEAESGSALDDVARTLPAVQRAGKLQGRAERSGFEWPRDEDLFAKVDEELDELRHEVREAAPRERVEHEVGDLLFAAVGLARRLGMDPETALRRSNERFERRFRHMERTLQEEGRGIGETDFAELKRRWQGAKAATDGDAE